MLVHRYQRSGYGVPVAWNHRCIGALVGLVVAVVLLGLAVILLQ